jgi:succinate-semialdehyde dehydrogenase/glutarate-semialdehyde dehydrogenase
VTNELVKRFENLSRDELESRLDRAAGAFLSWRHLRFDRRGEIMRAAASAFREQKERLAGIITLEVGKPITESRGEIEKCALVCEFYAETAEGFLSPRTVESDADSSLVRYDPIGLVLAVMPWNYPFWQVFRFAAPALMAGNAALLKHAPSVPQCAIAIERLFLDAGLPEGVFTNLFISEAETGELIADGRVAAATLTGSTRAGSSVAGVAGAALKKTVLELGGSDPFIVLEDADLERAAQVGVRSRILNSGQTCISSKRFIVVQEVAEQFSSLLRDSLASVVVGDPALEGTQVGPLAREDLRQNLHRQVQESVEQGAELVLGGEVPEGPGWFYPVTMLTDVRPGMPVFDEETFGPVAPVIEADDESDAIEIANNTVYGLGASIWTRDTKRAEAMARRIDAGCVFVNGLVISDPRLPFGGIKRSGYGRELAEEGIREFVNIKTLWISG